MGTSGLPSASDVAPMSCGFDDVFCALCTPLRSYPQDVAMPFQLDTSIGALYARRFKSDILVFEYDSSNSKAATHDEKRNNGTVG